MTGYGLSQGVTRREDDRLLRGKGRFVDDEARPGLAHGRVLRSPLAHARIVRLDVSAAAAHPGVLAVATAADLAADGVGEIAVLTRPEPMPGTAYVEHPQPVLAADRVRYQGDGVAFVVAETPEAAVDALELVELELEPLPAVVGCDEATAPDAPPVWPEGNVAYRWQSGDRAATDAAFAAADRIAAVDVVNNRVVLCPIETRGAVGEYSEGRYLLATNTQMPNPLRDQIADGALGVDRAAVRVRVADVGGGFGGKNSLYPEQVLVLWAARRLGRPVKWVGERSDAFVSDFHGRDNVTRGELALDADGRFLAIRVRTRANLGAYVASRGVVSTIGGTVVLSGSYRIGALHVEVTGAYTNTVPTDPYRGAGRPEVIYLLERLIDAAARDLGVDRVALRRRNLIPPDAFPYPSPTGLVYDACAFEEVMDAALDRAGWHRFEERRREALDRDRWRGIGFCLSLERCGGGGGLGEDVTLRFAPDGVLTVLSGTMSNGQGHETAYSQIVHDKLGLPFERIRIVQGDTDRVPAGNGTGGSWSIPMGGGAVALAADHLLERARALAAGILEASEADLEFADGRFTVSGTDLHVGLDTVAAAALAAGPGEGGCAPGLAGEARFAPEKYTFPYGCHVCEVEVDPETGAVDVVRYTAVHDVGRTVNPRLVAGQVHGGVTQGLGQALWEHTAYDAEGHLASGSFLDYCIPRADGLPAFDLTHWETASPSNPLGLKGCGEAGAAAAPPAVINALVDALAPAGVRHLDMPATPARVWAAASGRPE